MEYFLLLYYLVVGSHTKKLKKKCKENKAKDWFKAIKEDEQLLETSKYLCMRRVYNKKNYFYIILKEKFDFSDESFCILAHEVLHAVQFILDGILDRDREFESEAYLHSHIMKQCLETLRNKITTN